MRWPTITAPVYLTALASRVSARHYLEFYALLWNHRMPSGKSTLDFVHFHAIRSDSTRAPFHKSAPVRSPKASPVLRMRGIMKWIVLVYDVPFSFTPACQNQPVKRKLVVVSTVSVHFKAPGADCQLWKRFQVLRKGLSKRFQA